MPIPTMAKLVAACAAERATRAAAADVTAALLLALGQACPCSFVGVSARGGDSGISSCLRSARSGATDGGAARTCPSGVVSAAVVSVAHFYQNPVYVGGKKMYVAVAWLSVTAGTRAGIAAPLPLCFMSGRRGRKGTADCFG